MTHLNGTTWAQFRAHLHRGGAYGYWWTLDEVKTYQITRGPRAGQQERCKSTIWWPVDKPLPLPNGATEHVYFGVHPSAMIPQERTGRDGPYTPKPEFTRPVIGEIAAINCLFGEFDAKDFADGKAGARAHIDQLAVKPTALIDSGGGYHAYWLLLEPTIITDANRATIRTLQNRWVEFIDADHDSKDLARVLRVPGRRNVKAKYGPDFPLVAFVYADFDQLYTLHQLAAAIPPQITAVETPAPAPFAPTPGDHSAYVKSAYDGERAAVLGALDGTKHHTLRNAAIKLGGLIWTGAISEHEITDGLQDAAERNGCDIGYAHRTIANGITYGAARPRTIADRQYHTSDQQVITPTAPRFTIAPEEALMDLPPIRYLDRDLGLVAKAFHLIYGASGSGKTFFAIERAMRQVAQGRRVLYIATEDTQGLRYRIAAWRRANPGIAGRLTWLQMPEGLDLQDYNQVAELVEAVEPYQYDHIILDTLREAHSGDENSSQDTRRINRAIQRLVAAGAALDVVHHTGVNGERPRGSTALFGNADAVIKVEDDDGYIRISFDKLRNAPPRDSLLFGMVQQDTGLTDTDGEPVISVVLRPANQTTRRDAKLSPIQRKVLQTLALSIFDGIGAKAQQVIDTAEITRRNTYLALASLKTRGFISQGDKGDPYMITPAGRAQLGSDLVSSASQRPSDQSDQQVINSDQHPSGSEVITSDHTRRVITGSHTRTADSDHHTGVPPDLAYRAGIPIHKPDVNTVLWRRQIEAEAAALAAANPNDDDDLF